ncbi:transporter substrate-binding domain-containing protein [Pseudodesulfovibrio sp. zrk46]|uniref:substrate-binding periplasmic protein n=1 Tax=Pseudodesulfovibrio sp. zrk46 TaxID=2725288 RepID=UPI0014499ECF|nr:transporter substrate-binding domain-containing protein [Pseudodesulfovibrio sp. zrk46]QJB55060.1 transporter substrate-binding domain-containing protein [Pseudodesulfovibrio sp. zrk46]
MRNRPFPFAIAILLFIAVIMTGTSHATDRPMRIVCDIWPPYQIKTETVVSGYSTEVVEEVYKRMGAPIDTLTAFPWKRALNLVETGHADALFSANHTKDREAFAYYPDEVLFESPWVIWTRPGVKFNSLEDLKDKRVGVVLGYSYTNEFWDFIQTYCTVEAVTTDLINFKKLSLNRLDAIAAEYGNGMHILQQLGIKNIVPRNDVVIKKDGLYIMFNREAVSKSFVQRFSEELKKFKTTPEHEALREKYFGEPAQ